jgi:ABC-type amino acid transport substrate-binding protein
MIKGLLLPMLHQPRARLGVTVPSLLPSLLLALVCLGGAGVAGAGVAGAGVATAGEVKPGENGQAQRVLRVGVLAGAAPCSFNNNGDWQGLAVELWARVARRKHIPYQLQAAPNATALLNDAAANRIDLGVGCLSLNPERVAMYRFSLPFQEEGLAVLMRRSRLELGRAMLQSLLAPDLLRLLAGYLSGIVLVAALIWQIEGHANSNEAKQDGKWRHFLRIFQILATGPGTNTIVRTSRGQALVICSYGIRIVSASLLVSYITLNVVRQPQANGIPRQRGLAALAGLRVAVRPGSSAERTLRTLGAARPITLVPMRSIVDAGPLLNNRQVDAAVADDLQMQYVQALSSNQQLELVLSAQQPASQGFVFSPALEDSLANRIDQAISELKREGVVVELQQQLLDAAERSEARGVPGQAMGAQQTRSVKPTAPPRP